MLENLNRLDDAKVCYLLSEGMISDVEGINRQTEILKNPGSTFINITGTRHYRNFEPFDKNTISI